MVAASQALSQAVSRFFQYNTPRMVIVRSRFIGIIYRLVQLPILLYLIGYIFIYKKAYQDFETAESSVLSKLKGVLQARDFTHTIWDSTDISILPQETTSFFIPTNYLFTPNQTRRTCPEDPHLGTPGVFCMTDRDCPAGEPTTYGNGEKTGKCVKLGETISTCEIQGWCPTEVDIPPREILLTGFESITVLIKNHIAFAKFGVKRRNILFHDEQRMMDCHILQLAGENITQIAARGGIIGFNINWNCDLDYDVERCIPQYSFKRLDNHNDVLAKGWNFRQANYWHDVRGEKKRDLIKLYGIRVVFSVKGRAGKFSAVMFAMNLGASVGLLGIASMICDFALIRIFGSDESLQAQKYLRLDNLRRPRLASRANVCENYYYYPANGCGNPPTILANEV
ncbi:P2X purinoceptor 4 [Hypsibius exemplaris]|uniref:P2X purinoceptor 4 n=1 Tax=Hypsibius exemplaris TaxID=2072580 RepID=A0A1W0WB33_HYPEX|nr:P2X purinoceptor 4 [Hypsibius exemplaris]